MVAPSWVLGPQRNGVTSVPFHMQHSVQTCCSNGLALLASARSSDVPATARKQLLCVVTFQSPTGTGDFLVAFSGETKRRRHYRSPLPLPNRRQGYRRSCSATRKSPLVRRQESRRSHRSQKEKGATAGAVAPFGFRSAGDRYRTGTTGRVVKIPLLKSISKATPVNMPPSGAVQCTEPSKSVIPGAMNASLNTSVMNWEF